VVVGLVRTRLVAAVVVLVVIVQTTLLRLLFLPRSNQVAAHLLSLLLLQPLELLIQLQSAAVAQGQVILQCREQMVLIQFSAQLLQLEVVAVVVVAPPFFPMAAMVVLAAAVLRVVTVVLALQVKGMLAEMCKLVEVMRLRVVAVLVRQL
jgi:hypothetical protein